MDTTHPHHGQARLHKYSNAVILTAFALALASGPMLLLVAEGSGVEDLLDIILWILFSILIATWCHYDSLERQQRISAWFRIAVVFFGFFALLYYLLKSRGLKRGLYAAAKAWGLIWMVFATMFGSALLFIEFFATLIPE